VTARIAAVIEGAGETWSDEYRFRRADGTYADVFDRGTVIRDDAGRACRMIGAMLDLSERKRAAEALRLAEERLRMAVQSAAIGTWDYDPTSDSLRWDARCKELFGLPPGAEVSYEGAFLAGLHPEDRARTQEAVAAALDPRGPGEYDIEYRTIGLTDGVERWIRAKGKAFFDGNTATRFIGTVIDVSDRKRVEELLRDTVAQQALMMGELSHRAKNNLALIAGLLGAQGRASSHPEVRQAIAEAQARIATVAQVHDQLWRTPNLERIDLARFLRDLCSKLQETAPHHRLLYEAVPVSVPANRAVALGLVVNEMVTNAFKYAYPGGAAGEVRVSLGASGDGLRLEVADRGVGLPKGIGFTSSDKSLGARIIGSFLHQLGAKLEIVSAGAGTSFVVHIPRI
jgi:two-component system, sensor histidine kinase PdtaS